MGDRLLEGRGLALTALLVAAPLAAAAVYAPVPALALIAGLALLGLVTLNSFGLLLVVVACVPWDDMLQYPSATLSLTKILGGLLLLGFVLRALTQSERLRNASNLLPLAIFEGIVLLATLASPSASDGVVKALRYILFGALTAIIVQIVRERRELHRVVSVLCASAAVAAGYGLWRFLSGTVDRAAGPISEANTFAYVLLTALPLAIYLATQSAGRARRLWWLAAGLLLIASAATLSRGAAVGFGALTVWALATRRVRVGGALASLIAIVVMLAGAFALYGPLINERLQQKGNIAAANVSSRKALWNAALQMAADHPVLGVGPGRYGIESANYITDDPIDLVNPYAHNSYLEVLAETGLPGLLAFGAFLLAGLGLARRARHRALDDGDRSLAALASALEGSMVVAIVSALFLSVQITPPFWLLGGLAACAALARTARGPLGSVT